jgi:hypothetical protein
VEERILTFHPEGKQGVNISRAKYESVKEAISEALVEKGEMSFRELGEAVKRKLTPGFEGSVSWDYTTVKLDLEARGFIKRAAGSRPQRIYWNERE